MIPAPFESITDRRALLSAMGAVAHTLIGAKSGIPTDEGVLLDFREPDALPKFGGFEMESTEPHGYAVDEDIAGIVHGDLIVRPDGTQYEIRQVHADGTGITNLVLRKL